MGEFAIRFFSSDSCIELQTGELFEMFHVQSKKREPVMEACCSDQYIFIVDN